MVAQFAAIIVTWQPLPDELDALLMALRNEVERTWIVDNASDPALALQITALAAREGATLLRNEVNEGVAAALNRGLAAVAEAGFERALLLDQDSLPQAGMVAALDTALRAGGDRLAAVGPAQLDARHGHAAPFIRIGFPFNHKLRAEDAPVECDFLITSGTLLRMSALQHIGLMDAGLFIDNVDMDWCFRARALGYALAGVPAARMRHRIGDRLQWRPGGRAVVHGPTRLYYIMRNRLLLYRRTTTPRVWIAQDMPRALLKFAGFSLAVRPRLRNLRAMLRGMRDGLAGRSGPAPGSL